MSYLVEVHFKCRRERLSGIKSLQVAEAIAKGAICPTAGQLEEMEVTHPAINVAGKEAAKKFPEKCSLCGLAPEWQNFEIR